MARWIIALVAVGAAAVGLAGCHRPTRIEGVVWFDTNLDGIRDPDEELAAGVTVRVSCDYSDPRVFDRGECATGTTDDDGRYEVFIGVEPRGETRGLVSFEAPEGFQAGEPPGVTWFFLFLHSDQRNLDGIDAALTPTGSGGVGDFVWRDDGDGVQEASEPGEPGIPVELQTDRGEVLASTVTDADGRYLFEAVPDGPNVVSFGPLPPGLRFAPNQLGLGSEDSDADPYSGRVRVIVEGGEVDRSIDAGVVTAAPGELGVIGDFVWADLDADGAQDVAEPGQPGVEVHLVGANTGPLSLTITDAAGRYQFLVSRAIAPDQPYRLVFFAPPGLVLAPPDAAGDDAIDSDPTTRRPARPLISSSTPTRSTTPATPASCARHDRPLGTSCGTTSTATASRTRANPGSPM